MAYIQPQTEVYILRGIPFENNYEHSILFDGANGATNQENYFKSKVRLIASAPGSESTYAHYNNYTYQRSGINKIRIGAMIEKFVDCNYMMFKNTYPQFEHKWFYAFITGVDYINNNVTEITYEIDVIQTWMFDYSLQECFVEREHSETDEVGDNTVPENLEVGDYVYKYIDTYNCNDNSHKQEYMVVIAAPFKINLDYVDGVPVVTTETADTGFYNGHFTGLYLNYYALNTTQQLLDLWSVTKYLIDNKKEEIIAIYMIPYGMFSSQQLVPVNSTSYQHFEIEPYNWDLYGINQPAKNKKLYTFPFSGIKIISSDGDEEIYKCELFNLSNSESEIYDKTKYNFKVEGVVGLPPQMDIVPLYYAEDKENESESSNINNRLFVRNFPMCSWSTDCFQAWLAQTTTGLIGGGLAYGGIAALTAANPAITGVAAFSKMSFAASAYSSVAGLGKAAIQGKQGHGESKNLILKSAKLFGFNVYYMHIKPEYAAIIDDYFTKYGYATKRLKVPDLHSRTYWNYIETKNCNINQSYNGIDKGLNIEDTRKISDIYDHGITFWHPTVSGITVSVDVGDYSKDNSPVTTT